MPERSLKLRALLFLYGNANILGCALALLGPALLFAGFIDRGWLLITAGLYVAGLLLGRKAPELERRIEDSLSIEQTLERLDHVVAQAQPHLTEDMRKSLDSVRGSVGEVLPRLVGDRSNGDDLFTVRETVLRYLPETLANYVALPPAFRITHAVKDGKTARQLLGEQLGLLDAKLREIVANVASSDAAALVANGQFLEKKFRQPDFLVG
ncbi:hypothetical protein DBV14_24425 [Variovorax sp. KBW07]|uniref:hypothetical protein n=1 Tax=Variovorax sp. KBW07 TaxID=2153358 RepID=UPI000F57D762|nr:hypothetical protein [Variovorax sp. KBW07]RQO45070.1 hypothetical protein DBV14_24425 [Variovorax sp. KBW07]